MTIWIVTRRYTVTETRRIMADTRQEALWEFDDDCADDTKHSPSKMTARKVAQAKKGQ